MKKIVRTSLNNVANKRGVRDLNIQLYSHDKNNAGFEFVIKNEVDLSEYKAKVLFDFQESFATWETKGTVEGNVVKVRFDTTFITKCEEVIGYLFLDSETDTLDVFKFKFNVVLSEIDKYDTAKRGFRYIKDQEVVDVITRSELEEELKKLQINGGIDLSNYLTTGAANETFATKQELSMYATKDELPSISGLVTTEQLIAAKNSVVEEINNKGYVTSTVAEETYAKKSDLPAPYNDSALAERVTNLENKTDRDTVYNDTEVKERLTTLENKPPLDLSNYATKQELASVSGNQLSVDNLVTKDELASKNYLTTHQDISNLATKQELQEVRDSQPTVDTSNLVTKQELESKGYLTEIYLNSSELSQRVSLIEEQPDKDTVYDDTALKERVTALESKAIEGGAYDDTHLRKRLDTLEAKQDKDTVYDDAPLKERLVALETKVDKDTVYNDEEVKRRLTELENKPVVDTSHFITDETLDSKNFLTTIVAEETYAKKTEIPQPYNDSALAGRIAALEIKTDKDTVYDDTSIKERLTNLESKPAVDTSRFITEESLESKGFLTTHQDISNLATKEELAKAVTKEELEEKHYVTNEQISSTYATKSEIPQPYSDTELVKRITVLENKQDNDTVYDDAELKRRVTALEEKPSVDTSNFVTTAVLESKGYLTAHQDISNLVTKEELHEATEIDYSNIVTTDELEPYAKKSELPAPYNDSALVSRVSVLESKQDKDTVYNDTEVKQRLTALENRPTVGGAQTQDTGWITISENNPINGNIVKIRRINDMVHVSLSNSDYEGVMLEMTDGYGAVLADKTIPKGFTPMKTIILPVEHTPSDYVSNVSNTDVTGYAIFKVENNKATLNVYDSEISSGIPTEKYINDFSYFTEDPFPTNLH